MQPTSPAVGGLRDTTRCLLRKGTRQMESIYWMDPAGWSPLVWWPPAVAITTAAVVAAVKGAKR